MLQYKFRPGWGWIVSILFMTSLLFACHPASVFAEKTEVNFEAKAVLPENQRSEASYYDLKVEPNQS